VTYLVFSDLDGTLLDHDSYSFAPALPALYLLAQRTIPVIPVSSKTRAEIVPLLKALHLDSPFIVENGAAVFLPEAGLTPDEKAQLSNQGDYFVKAFAPPRSYWQAILSALNQRYADCLFPMSQFSVEQLMNCTGLDRPQAQRARQREYSEPCLWLGDERQFDTLVQYCRTMAIMVVRGGRFVHFLKGTDKGQALLWLKAFIQQRDPTRIVQSIALGDGANDSAMLEVADLAVQVRSASHGFPELTRTSVYRTQELGPAGWNEAILHLLQSGRTPL
jgi:mannosyl-3-phosphoglycerate phosphatase